MLDFNLFSDIPDFSEWTTIQKINKGWSTDEKYYIETKTGAKLLLRLADINLYEKKKKEFFRMQEVYNLDINMSKPLIFGKCGNNKYTYSLFSWIEGESAQETIINFSEKEQYAYGIEAGKILKKMHSLPAPQDQEDWEERMKTKITTHLEKYQKSPYKLKNDEYVIEYIQKNLHLLKNRPQNYQHGDYHLGNMLITPNNELAIIDFNRWDFGDTYEEFYKMMLFSSLISEPFTLGQINGYFDNKIPDDFFNILSLYVADVLLFSIVWAIPFGVSEVEGMIKRAEKILENYDNFKTTIPKWFRIINTDEKTS